MSDIVAPKKPSQATAEVNTLTVEITEPLESGVAFDHESARAWVDGENNVYYECPAKGSVAIAPQFRRFRTVPALNPSRFEEACAVFRERTGRDPGLLILRTPVVNARRALYEASKRGLHFVLEYPNPDEEVTGKIRMAYLRYYRSTENAPSDWLGGYGIVSDTAYTPRICHQTKRGGTVIDYEDGPLDNFTIKVSTLNQVLPGFTAFDTSKHFSSMSLEEVVEEMWPHTINARLMGNPRMLAALQAMWTSASYCADPCGGACLHEDACLSCDGGFAYEQIDEVEKEGEPECCPCTQQDLMLACFANIPDEFQSLLSKADDYTVVVGPGGNVADLHFFKDMWQNDFAFITEVPLAPNAVWASRTKGGQKASFYEPDALGLVAVTREVAESLAVSTLDENVRYDRDAVVEYASIALSVRRGLSIEEATQMNGKTVQWYKDFQAGNPSPANTEGA